MTRTRLLVITAVIALSAFALRLFAGNRSYHQDLHWIAPESAISRPNPLAGNADAVKGGRKLFLRHCAACHGGDGTGIGRAANLQSADVQIESDGILFWKITNGNLDRGMPAFSGMPALERWQLALYIHKMNAGGR
jgi:mono/diheme cytochrome c family protein